MGNAYDYSIILNHELMERNYHEKFEDMAAEIYRLLLEFRRLSCYVDFDKMSSLARDVLFVSTALLEYPYVLCRDSNGDIRIHKPLSREGYEDLLRNPLYVDCWAAVKIKSNGRVIQ